MPRSRRRARRRSADRTDDGEWLTFRPLAPDRDPRGRRGDRRRGRAGSTPSNSGRESLEARFLELVGRRAWIAAMTRRATHDRHRAADDPRARPRRIIWLLAALTIVSVALVGVRGRATGHAGPRGWGRRARDPGRRLAGPDPHRLHVQLRAGDDGRVPRRAGHRRRHRVRRRARAPRSPDPTRRPARRPLARSRDRRRRVHGRLGRPRDRASWPRSPASGRPSRSWPSPSSRPRRSCS